MNIAGFYEESISNGPGWRAVLFVSGCPHHCLNCQNEEAKSYDYGKPFEKEKIIDQILDNSILKGITISGGEPLCLENIEGVLDFITSVKKEKPHFTVWCYTGYTLEELKKRKDKITQECLKKIDVLVDGRFIEAKKDPTLKFKGSSNQRIIDMAEVRKENRIVELEIQ